MARKSQRQLSVIKLGTSMHKCFNYTAVAVGLFFALSILTVCNLLVGPRQLERKGPCSSWRVIAAKGVASMKASVWSSLGVWRKPARYERYDRSAKSLELDSAKIGTSERPSNNAFIAAKASNVLPACCEKRQLHVLFELLPDEGRVLLACEGCGRRVVCAQDNNFLMNPSKC